MLNTKGKLSPKGDADTTLAHTLNSKKQLSLSCGRTKKKYFLSLQRKQCNTEFTDRGHGHNLHYDQAN